MADNSDESGHDGDEGAEATDPGLIRRERMMSERLREAVERAGGRPTVAKRAGIPLRTLANYLSGRGIKGGWVGPLADACGVNVDWLATGRGAMGLPPGFEEAAAILEESYKEPLDEELLEHALGAAIDLGRMMPRMTPSDPIDLPTKWIVKATIEFYTAYRGKPSK